MKLCSKCKKNRDSKEFYKDLYKKDGLTSQCKECRKESAGEYYRKNKDKQCARAKIYRNTNRESYNEYQKRRREDRIDAWVRGFLAEKYGTVPHCEICGRELRWKSSSSEREKSVCFDHWDISEIKSPKAWLMRNKPTQENVAMFKKENFGILCFECNRNLPTGSNRRSKLLIFLQKGRKPK